jgi:hypothetical protein
VSYRWIGGVLAAALGIAAGLLAGIRIARADPAPDLLDAMRAGGLVLLVRHAETVPGTGEREGFRIDDCRTQRRLSDTGRAQARQLGTIFRKLAIPVAEVRSSMWCASLDAANLAFQGHAIVRPWPALNPHDAAPEAYAGQDGEALAALASIPERANWVWVTQDANVASLSGVRPAEGELVVARPVGGRLEAVGRWTPD